MGLPGVAAAARRRRSSSRPTAGWHRCRRSASTGGPSFWTSGSGTRRARWCPGCQLRTGRRCAPPVCGWAGRSRPELIHPQLTPSRIHPATWPGRSCAGGGRLQLGGRLAAGGADQEELADWAGPASSGRRVPAGARARRAESCGGRAGRQTAAAGGTGGPAAGGGAALAARGKPGDGRAGGAWVGGLDVLRMRCFLRPVRPAEQTQPQHSRSTDVHTCTRADVHRGGRCGGPTKVVTPCTHLKAG